MSSPDRDKLQSIEAARAVAALLVVLMHAANLMRVEHFSGHIGLNDVFGFGYVGVDFFFVLSGFIITYVHLKDFGQAGRLGNYLWRRFSRIYPIYWFMLLLSIAATVAARLVMGKDLSLDLQVSDLWGTMLLLPSQEEPKYVGVAWSLQYEILFYAVFCAFFIVPRVAKGLFFAWFIYLLGRVAGLWDLHLPFHLNSAHCLQFLLGIAIGWTVKNHHLRAGKRALVAAIVLFGTATALEFAGPFGKHSDAGRLFLGIAAAALIGALVAAENTGSIRTPAWLVQMGSVSYSIYLGHILFINSIYLVLQKLGLYHALPEVVVYAIGVTLSVATTFFIGKKVEIPMVRLLKSWTQRRGHRTRPA